MIMKSLKITLLFAVLATIFVLTVSGVSQEATQNVTEEVKTTPSIKINNVAGVIKKKGKPSQA